MSHAELPVATLAGEDSSVRVTSFSHCGKTRFVRAAMTAHRPLGLLLLLLQLLQCVQSPRRDQRRTPESRADRHTGL